MGQAVSCIRGQWPPLRWKEARCWGCHPVTHPGAFPNPHLLRQGPLSTKRKIGHGKVSGVPPTAQIIQNRRSGEIFICLSFYLNPCPPLPGRCSDFPECEDGEKRRPEYITIRPSPNDCFHLTHSVGDEMGRRAQKAHFEMKALSLYLSASLTRILRFNFVLCFLSSI